MNTEIIGVNKIAIVIGEGALHIYNGGTLATYNINDLKHNLRVLELLQAPGVTKIGVDVKDTIKALTIRGVAISGPFFDVNLGAKLLGQQLCFMPQASMLSFCEGLDRQAADLDEKLTSEGMYRLFGEVEMPLVPVLAEMELRGVAIDVESLERAVSSWEGLKEGHRNECHDLASGNFNVNSFSELSRCLFTEQDLPPMGATATGYSTDKKSLELLTKYSALPVKVLDYRKTQAELEKALGIQKALCLDNAVHPTFYQLGAGTGRMSCKNPNMHSMPEEARKFFIPRPGFVFLYADFSQVQSRILAHLSGDKKYRELFQSGGDIHRLMASQIFELPMDEVKEPERTAAKKIVHGITNNEGAARIASDLKIKKETAQGYIDQFFRSFPGIVPYKLQAMAELRDRGYVESIMGRRSYYPMSEIHSPDRSQQSRIERSAFISILQMSEADIMKSAILAADADPVLTSLGARMLLSVHDSLLVEVHDEHKHEAASRLKDIMEGVVELSVPVRVGVEWGFDWGALEKMNL